MNETEYREKFKEFLNDEVRYRKFIAIINRAKDDGLLFWQVRVIEKFCQQYSIDSPSFSDLRRIFNICELHGTPLEHGRVKVFRGHVDYSKDYEKACADLFSNSHLSEVNGPKEMQGKYYNIRFCQTCREAQEQWGLRNAQQIAQVSPLRGWTVFKSQSCGFAAQKYSTKLQLKSCRLARR